MSKNTFSLMSGLFLLSASALALAQAPAQVVGRAVDVEGLVTVSQGANVRTVLNDSPVIDGTRYVTASTGSVTLKFKDACDVKLKPNQSLEVDSRKPCAALIAAVQTLGNPAGGAVVAGGGDGLKAGGLLVGGTWLVNNVGTAAAVAGAGGGTPVTPPPGGSGGNEGGVVNPPASGQ